MTDRTTLLEHEEAQRLTNLLSLNILDTPPQREFDELTRMAALACDAASAAITLVDADRVWCKSRVCVEVEEVGREHAFCSLDVARGDILVIPDTWLDERCRANPLITGDKAIRFYAGAALITTAGRCIGRVCVFDEKPRAGLLKGQEDALINLARIAVDLMESNRHRRIGQVAAKVADVTSDAILCADAEGVITYWNTAAEIMFGHPATAAIGAPLDIIMPDDLKQAHHGGFNRAASGAPMTLAGRPVELTAKRADGSTFPIELTLGRWLDDGKVAFAAIIRDVSARKLLEREREQARMFLDTVIESLPAMLFVKDAGSRRYLLMNKAGAEIAGRPREDFVGRTDSELFPGQGEAYEARDVAASSAPGVHLFESEHVRADGQRFSLRTKRVVVDGANGEHYLLGMTEDVTEARRAQAEVKRMAEYDSLTGLRNRAGFVTRVEKLVASATAFTLLSVDLDRFKAVNDQFGHLAGDEVLAQVGHRLSELARRGDLVARIGGDEFAMILTGKGAAQRAGELAPQIIAALETPMQAGRLRAFIGASVGGASYPGDGHTPAEIRQAADLALYRAKENGRGSACFYSSALDAVLRDRRQLEQALRQTLSDDAIDVAFQPVFEIRSGVVTSFEALARWQHPTRGLISPADFISLAEECGLIDALGTRVLCKACEEAMTWPRQIAVAVNLSPLQFQSGRLCSSIKGILRDTGLAPERLQLEVTEGLLIRDVDRTFQQLEDLRALGIQILMDDFGVGYSSLSYFQRFRFDKVKIDRSFVDTAPSEVVSQAIIKAVAQVGATLNMGVVAEGVETNRQLEILADLGCTHVQGYLLSRPLPRQLVHNFLNNVSWPSAKSPLSVLG